MTQAASIPALRAIRVDPDRQMVVATIPVGSHPSVMAIGPAVRLFVADTDSDAISVIDMSTNAEVDRISVAPIFNAPFSSSPVGLGVSPDGKDLYVANAGDNAIAVFAIRADGSDEYFQGWIPTGWYPTSVTVSPDGRTLFVTKAQDRGRAPTALAATRIRSVPPSRASPPCRGTKTTTAPVPSIYLRAA